MSGICLPMIVFGVIVVVGWAWRITCCLTIRKRRSGFGSGRIGGKR